MTFWKTIQTMTKKLQSNKSNPPSGTKFGMRIQNLNRGASLLFLVIMTMATMTTCGTSDAALKASLTRMTKDVNTMKTAVTSLKSEQSELAKKSAMLFEQYRQLYVYYVTLDSIADTTGTTAAIIRDQQIVILNQMASLTLTMRTLNDLFNQTSDIVGQLGYKIAQIELELKFMPRDTVVISRDTVLKPVMMGNGNIIMNQPITDDTMNIIIDSVWFRLWRDGSDIQHAGFKSTKKQPINI